MSPAAKPIEGHGMQLPPQLCHAIALETAQYNLQSLTQAATELSENYRSQRSASGMFMATAAHRLAYAAVRMPATFAAARAVFTEMRRLMPDRRITSLLDLGAGPGTAGWAALEVFDEVQEITLVEQDEGWIRTGKSLARTGENVMLAHADWVHANVRAVASFPAHDLVVSSYALGEMAPKVSREIVQVAWAAARTAIVIIEPGTMRGFELIRLLRDELIALGGQVIAPCPHQDECPIPTNDWCHFAQRFARASLHRRIKFGTLGYEDEKFSYIVASKHLGQPVNARVIRHPLRHSGHTRMRLCTGDGLQTITVTRSDNEYWQRARKIEWGDQWP
jgi:ribosomal protein RSM22 (predicted rRNA methylase)